jgi:hypothetical protein
VSVNFGPLFLTAQQSTGSKENIPALQAQLRLYESNQPFREMFTNLQPQ